MTPTKYHRAPLTKRISVLAITAAASFSFAAFSPQAHAADSKELTALKAALAANGTTLETANAAQLADSVGDAIAANAGLKPGNIAGEALKGAGSNAQDAGDEIGTRVIAEVGLSALVARDAIKRAGSGKGLNVNLVPDFTTVFVASDPEAIDLAQLVKSTKPGAGAVIGGRASELTTTGAQITLANASLVKSEGLTGAAQDILKYTAQAVDADAGGLGDTANLALQVATGNGGANAKLAPKIGAGAAAGDPTNAGNIADALLDEGTLPKLKSGIAGFVKGIATVADIEEISKIAVSVADQINTPIPGGSTTNIKFAAASGVVKNLAKAIVAKATTTNLISDRNRYDNKVDEIAEVAAFMIGKALNTHVVQGTGGGKAQVSPKNVGSKIVSIILSAVNATKPKKIQAAPGAGSFYVDTAIDVAGSVAETLSSMRNAVGQTISPTIFDAIKGTMLAKAKNIGGKTNAQAVIDAINAAYETGGDPVTNLDVSFEDGTITANATVSDPETDFRPQ